MGQTIYDVVIVGGSHAGLSCALILARAGRKILVIDKGSPRAVHSTFVHGYHTRDGENDTDKLLTIARTQLGKYSHVKFMKGEVRNVKTHENSFAVSIINQEILGKKLVLATGVSDLLPQISGLKDLWGKLAFRCPYCDGWELKDENIAVIGSGEELLNHLTLLRIWSKSLTLYTNGIKLSDKIKLQLEAFKIPIIDAALVSIKGVNKAFVEVTDTKKTLSYRGIFLWPQINFHHSLAKQLGCKIELSGPIDVNHNTCECSIEGVYAIGDVIEPEIHMVALAVSSGLRAAFAINNSLAGHCS